MPTSPLVYTINCASLVRSQLSIPYFHFCLVKNRNESEIVPLQMLSVAQFCVASSIFDFIVVNRLYYAANDEVRRAIEDQIGNSNCRIEAFQPKY